jgi:hypothetical protein
MRRLFLSPGLPKDDDAGVHHQCSRNNVLDASSLLETNNVPAAHAAGYTISHQNTINSATIVYTLAPLMSTIQV